MPVCGVWPRLAGPEPKGDILRVVHQRRLAGYGLDLHPTGHSSRIGAREHTRLIPIRDVERSPGSPSITSVSSPQTQSRLCIGPKWQAECLVEARKEHRIVPDCFPRHLFDQNPRTTSGPIRVVIVLVEQSIASPIIPCAKHPTQEDEV
eukprot:1816797-Prymnesium_polylepis.1